MSGLCGRVIPLCGIVTLVLSLSLLQYAIQAGAIVAGVILHLCSSIAVNAYPPCDGDGCLGRPSDVLFQVTRKVLVEVWWEYRKCGATL